MVKDYIAPAAALRKLKEACDQRQNVYIYGVSGYGKTELVQQFLADRPHKYFSFSDVAGNIEKLPDDQEDITLVLDHLQLVTSNLVKEKLLALCYRPNVWLILISRSILPHWLRPVYVHQGFAIIQEEDLRLGPAEMNAYLQTQQLEFSPAELVHLEGATYGNAYALRYATLLLKQGQQIGPEFYQQVWDAYAEFMENCVFPSWDSVLLEFFMQLSVVDSFNLELAKMISANSRAAALLQRAMETDNLLRLKDGLYHLSPITQQTLRSLAEKRLGPERLREAASRAALYYEMHGQFLPALNLLEEYGKEEQIKSLLLHNARLHPGAGYYFQMRHFYLRLTEEEITGNVALMAGMSMLYSLLLQPEASELWYNRLRDFAAGATHGQKREALSRLAYLDISLPHRGSRCLTQVLETLPALLEKDVALPEISITDNLPSVLNGAKDFCWMIPQPPAETSRQCQIINQALRPAAKGLLEAAQGERLYEQGGDTYEILRLLSRSRLDGDLDGSLNLAFVSIGLRARLNLLHGDVRAAREIVQPFAEQAQKQNAAHLLPNIRALCCRIALYAGNQEAVNRWLTEAPNESKEFNTLERYRYLTKARCYISGGNYLQAQSLLEKLRYYAEQHQRPYISLEVGMLSAIIKERQNGDWQQELLSVLRQASRLRFIRLLSEEGAAISPLLQALHKECAADPEIDQQWFRRLREEAAAMAARYPVYLKDQLAEVPNFSQTALTILRMQADGLSVNKIAEQLGMKAVTVKYHTRENYRKLGVSGKTDAVLAARDLGIL